MIRQHQRLTRIALGEECDEEEKHWQYRMAFEVRDRLAFSKKELGLCTATKLEIEWKNPDQPPIAQKPYHYGYDDLKFTKDEIAGLLEADLIRETAGPWAKPVVIARRIVHD